MLRFVRAFLPKAIMMENVPRLISHKSFRDLCKGLREIGYELTYDVKDASRYGVPQRRRRLILLGSRRFKIEFAKENKRVRTVHDAIGHMAEPGKSRDALHNLPEKKRVARIVRLIRDIPKNGGSRGDLPRYRQLKCHKKVDGFRDVYGRMAWNSVSPTITSGCFNPSKGRFLHPERDRAITMREAALLQTFPRGYVFDATDGKSAVARLIGNALPPEFIRRHAAQILRELRIRGEKKAA
jgi:DNA (cytosine-5)-methyltransferase 1